jgi:SAM-dependent methyltransferase
VRRSLAVSKERWRQAQDWELAFWVRDQARKGWKRVAFPALRPILSAVGSRRATGDDWNFWWRDRFDGYAFLPADLGDFIELGCGPYTNTRLILPGRSVRRVICSDPLASEYLKFRHRWLATAHRKGLIEIDTHPIEELPFEPGSFDVVVLINVLDHVMNAERCLRTAIDLVRSGGFFVFGQDLVDKNEAANFEWFQQGHPIAVELSDLEPHFTQLQPILRQVIEKDQSRDPRLQTGVFVFAGCKR